MIISGKNLKQSAMELDMFLVVGKVAVACICTTVSTHLHWPVLISY